MSAAAEILRALADRYADVSTVLWIDEDAGGRPVRLRDLLRDEATRLDRDGDAAAPVELTSAEHQELWDNDESCGCGGVGDALYSAVERMIGKRVDDLRSRLACVLEASYWDRPYDTRLDAIRGMCDLTTDGMTPAQGDR